MSEEPTGRDLRVIWQTGVVIACVAMAVIGGILTAVVWAVRQDARLQAVERWQSEKDRAAARELWRRDRERENRP